MAQSSPAFGLFDREEIDFSCLLLARHVRHNYPIVCHMIGQKQINTSNCIEKLIFQNNF